MNKHSLARIAAMVFAHLVGRAYKGVTHKRSS